MGVKTVNSDSYNVNEYRKFSWDEVKDLVLSLSDWKSITRTKLCNNFTNQLIDGKVVPPKYRLTDFFDLPAGILQNQKEAVNDTTIGIFIFNVLCVDYAFNHKLKYQNDTLDAKNYGKFEAGVMRNLLNGNFTPEEFGEFQNTVLWIGYFTELTMPGCSVEFMYPLPKIMKRKQELLKQKSELMSKKTITDQESVEYKEDVEDVLVKEAQEELKDDPTMRLYNLKKPSFGNNYKNSYITNGPLFDPVTGERMVNERAYGEGITRDNYVPIANKSMTSSFHRGVATQDGGADAKYLNAAMQNVYIGPPNSDCGSKFTIDYKIGKDIEYIQYSYCIYEGKLTLMTPEWLKQHIGETVHMRSPLYCKHPKYICEVCAGKYFSKIGFKNIGLTASNVSNTIMQRDMKAMHDITIKFTPINVKEKTQFEY